MNFTMYKSNHIITFKHYLILSIIAFATGIFVIVSLRSDFVLQFSLFLAVLLSAIIILLLINRITRRPRFKYFLLPGFLILFIFLGMFRIITTEFISPGVLKNYEGKSAWLSGTVLSTATPTSKGYSDYFEFEVQQINFESISPEHILVYVPQSRSSYAVEGKQVYCWADISTPYRREQKDNYDYYTYLRGKNIFFVSETQNITPTSFHTPFSIVSSIRKTGFYLREKIVSAIDNMAFSNKHATAILKGILIGDKSDFSDELYLMFSNAGISHIVAVSGMHLSILFSILILLLHNVQFHHKQALFLSVPVIIIFVATAGFTPSVCRSAIMMLMMIGSNLLYQRYSPVNALFISLGIILVISPYSLFSKSLILSFGATFGILAYCKYILYLLKKVILLPKIKISFINNVLHRGTNFMVSSLAISFSAFMGTAYFTALLFGNVSYIQFITNLWIIPTVGIVFCLGTVTCIAFYTVPFIVPFLKIPLDFFINIISRTAIYFGDDKFAFQITEMSLPFVTFAVYAGTALMLYMFLKTLYDICVEKEKAAERFGRRVKGKSF